MDNNNPTLNVERLLDRLHVKIAIAIDFAEVIARGKDNKHRGSQEFNIAMDKLDELRDIITDHRDANR